MEMNQEGAMKREVMGPKGRVRRAREAQGQRRQRQGLENKEIYSLEMNLK